VRPPLRLAVRLLAQAPIEDTVDLQVGSHDSRGLLGAVKVGREQLDAAAPGDPRAQLSRDRGGSGLAGRSEL
jgi:hypothetical protein